MQATMRGEVVYQYAFDVAHEIVAARVPPLLVGPRYSLEIRAEQPQPRELAICKPLAFEPPALESQLVGQPVQVRLHVYEVGVVAVTMRVRFEVQSLAELQPFHSRKLADGRSLDDIALRLCIDAQRGLSEAMVGMATLSEPDPYTVFCLTEVSETTDVNAWLRSQRREVAELLAESGAGQLSDSQVDEVLRLQRSYTHADLVVTDWDAALVVDLTGYVEDVLHVLELASLQLEEYSNMDRQLGRHLERAYEDVRRKRWSLFGGHARMLQELRLFRVDLSRLSDEVTHVGKFIGDWYLALVYLAVHERFRLKQWRDSVEQRLSQLDHLYNVIQSDINDRRMLWLEVIIVLFFAIDLLAILLK